MVRQIVMINWRYIGDAVPSFITRAYMFQRHRYHHCKQSNQLIDIVMFIPFGYSAAYGLIAGLLAYASLNGLVYITKVISRGRIIPEDEDQREYWTIKPHGKLPWFVNAGEAFASYVGQRSSAREKPMRDSASMMSGLSEQRFHQFNHELDTVVTGLKDPRKDKVLNRGDKF